MTDNAKAVVKSDKATIIRRVDEVLRVVLAGGDFADIRQYATAQNWQVSDRQLRRYQERAYTKLANHAERDQKQLLGRHLMQRRALYARALKTNDVRAALLVLRDEAALEGLYELAKQEATQSQTATSSVSRRERFRRLLAARLTDDKQAVTLLEESSPSVWYRTADTWMPEMFLYTLTLMHVAEQLEMASMALLAGLRVALGDGQNGFWRTVAQLQAWNYSVGRDGWRLFVESLGVDPDELVEANHQGVFWEHFEEQVMVLCPEPDELRQILDERGQQGLTPITAEGIARQWREMLDPQLAK